MRAYAYRRRSRSPASPRSILRCVPHRRREPCRWPAAFGHVAPSRSGRLIEVDFFRGIVLLMIVVDHIGASVLSRVTLHAFAMRPRSSSFSAASRPRARMARSPNGTARARALRAPRDADLPRVSRDLDADARRVGRARPLRDRCAEPRARRRQRDARVAAHGRSRAADLPAPALSRVGAADVRAVRARVAGARAVRAPASVAAGRAQYRVVADGGLARPRAAGCRRVPLEFQSVRVAADVRRRRARTLPAVLPAHRARRWGRRDRPRGRARLRELLFSGCRCRKACSSAISRCRVS